MPKFRVVLFDLWMTLIHSLTKDPVLSLQEFLGHGQPGVLDQEFLTAGLTTNIGCEGDFLAHMAGTFKLTIGSDVAGHFAALLASERDGVQKYPETDRVLAELRRRGIRVGLVSNLWPFPVAHIFDTHGLRQCFEHLLFSFEVGARKPDRRIYEAAYGKFGVTPGECLFVGDSLKNDVLGPQAAGMSAVLINRSGVPTVGLPSGAREIASLDELLVYVDGG